MSDIPVGLTGLSTVSAEGQVLPLSTDMTIQLVGIAIAIEENNQLVSATSVASSKYLTGISASTQNGNITQGAPLSGQAPAVQQGSLSVRHTGNLSGRGFKTSPTIAGGSITSALIGGPFSTSPELYQAAIGTGSGFSSAPTLTAVARNESFLSGRGFATNLNAIWASSVNGTAAGRGFETVPTAFGGSVGAGRGFGTYPILIGTAPTFSKLSGRGFSTGFKASGEGYITAKLIGRGFNSGLGFSGKLTGRGFDTRLKAGVLDSAAFSSAFVMNIATGQVTRYTNFPFSNVLIVNEKYYGVTSSGFYLLEGTADAGVELVGSITTKDDDFGDMYSKNIPFAYLGCDDQDISVTPIVDGYEYPTYKESFDGRKVKMARGIKGRYWRLRIDKIKRLQSIETLQETLGRRVK